MTPDRSKAARELLAFYAEAGVDAAIGETAGTGSPSRNPARARDDERPQIRSTVGNIGGGPR